MGSSTWRVAASLLHLRDQINAAWPARNKASDGTIGDAAHQAGTSDHNPRVVSALGTTPVVLALDVTHDPGHGCDTYAVAEQLRLSRDRRISYVISNHRITGPSHGWNWGPYGGTDPHTNHMHVSVAAAAVADYTADWRIKALPTEGDPMALDLDLAQLRAALLDTPIPGTEGPDGSPARTLRLLLLDLHKGTGAGGYHGWQTATRDAVIQMAAEMPDLTGQTGATLSAADRELLTELRDALVVLHTKLDAVGGALAS
jgi:hypothetical protein